MWNLIQMTKWHLVCGQIHIVFSKTSSTVNTLMFLLAASDNDARISGDSTKGSGGSNPSTSLNFSVT